ncbi:MAG: hypothetical protein N3B18_14070 [Desulfobacterota bacterium]|nr:hypothetical protein [Thermodesulfobacteriota bacterium]
MSKRWKGWILLFLGMLYGATLQAHAAGQDEDAAIYDGEPVSRFTGTGFTFDLPIGHVGFELITEGTLNYPLTRKMRTIFPFDFDVTMFFAWGYTGDKISIKVQDAGDPGDRIFGIALSHARQELTPQWGTLYSSGGQNSFEIVIPMFPPGAIIYFVSGFFAPSKGAEAYGYTITVSFPQ